MRNTPRTVIRTVIRTANKLSNFCAEMSGDPIMFNASFRALKLLSLFGRIYLLIEGKTVFLSDSHRIKAYRSVIRAAIFTFLGAVISTYQLLKAHREI